MMPGCFQCGAERLRGDVLCERCGKDAARKRAAAAARELMPRRRRDDGARGCERAFVPLPQPDYEV